MKLRELCFVLASLGLLATAACNRELPTEKNAQVVSAEKAQALKDLEAHTGLSFPTNTILVYSSDGGGREASHRYYEWATFAPSPIKMPPMQATGVKDYLKLPLENTVEFVQSRFRKSTIEFPQVALSSSWQTNGFRFSGTLIRSSKGDYLVIQRGRIK